MAAKSQYQAMLNQPKTELNQVESKIAAAIKRANAKTKVSWGCNCVEIWVDMTSVYFWGFQLSKGISLMLYIC